MTKTITVETTVSADRETIWSLWTEARHIEQWMHAADDWECPKAENDVHVGGRFSFTLAAKDGSVSFDMTGMYTTVEQEKLLAYTMDDGRTVSVSFEPVEEGVHIVETFEMEHENSEELQRGGWQAILENFKKYAEAGSR